MHAGDIAEVFTVGGVDPIPFRLINIGRDSYTRNQADALPEGKKWSHRRDAKGFLWSSNLVDALNPEFLRLISPGARKVPTEDRYDGVRTTRYDGSIEVGGLGTRQAGVYYSERKGASAGGRMTWKLWLGPDRLPRRFQAEIVDEPYGQEERADAERMNVLYSGWRKPARTVAPPEKLVVESNRLAVRITL
ncbi:hypothetical protein [Nonomuraea sp. NPDC052265]|uniref:hypothetical protein n=1 Tax=Nonomuraea sp. NPDC052265 TaxID=3364374 RepID=UPI0037C62720